MELIKGAAGYRTHLILANFAKDPLRCRQAATLISRENISRRRRNLKKKSTSQVEARRAIFFL